MTEKIYISWEQFHNDCRHLAQLIKPRLSEFNKIVAVSRGGLLPAGILAYELDLRKCQTVNMASYDGVEQRRDDSRIELVTELAGVDEHTLIVDDLSDSGRTFHLLRGIYPKACFVSVYAKPHGKTAVDLFASEIPDQWVVFPWD